MTPVVSSSEDMPRIACRLGVVIVNYATPGLVMECVRSILPGLDGVDAKVAIIDNASPDSSVEQLTAFIREEGGGRVFLITAPENRGFSAGNNLGVSALDAQFYLFLNSDATAAPDALARLAAAAKPGIVAPRIDSGNGPEVSLFRNHSPLSEFVDGAQTGPITNLLPGVEVPIFPDDPAPNPDWVSFAAVMISADAMQAAGPMDEDFFLYYEDCDYCRRITRAGFDISLAPDAVFYHEAGGSTHMREKSGRSERLPAYYYASRSRYFRKYYGPAGPMLANFAWYAGRAIAKLRGVFGRRAPSVCEARARDIWIGWRGGA